MAKTQAAQTERKPRLVFISSCHSECAAAAFLKSGCSHVVACVQSAVRTPARSLDARTPR